MYQATLKALKQLSKHSLVIVSVVLLGALINTYKSATTYGPKFEEVNKPIEKSKMSDISSINLRTERQNLIFDLIDSDKFTPEEVKKVYDLYPDSICDCK